MKIRNINGTSQTTCKCGSWLKHWENFSGQVKPSYCPASGCLRTDLLGAHVQKGRWKHRPEVVYLPALRRPQQAHWRVGSFRLL